MIVGERVMERLRLAGISQAELARRIGVSQPTINNIIRRSKKGSTHLHKVARELGTTPAYLSGETDDPHGDAPSPAPSPVVQFLTMTVALPSEEALTQMYLAMLKSAIDADGCPLQGIELARDLAMLLPSALGNLRVPLIEQRPAGVDTPPMRSEDDGDARPAQRRA